MTTESRFDVSESSKVSAEQRNNVVGPSMSRKGDCTFLGILGRHGEEFVVVVLALEKEFERKKVEIHFPRLRLCAWSKRGT
jgi:hypothetical protein